MEKLAAVFACLFLVGCATPLVQPACGEKPVFKKYDIVMPDRPVLQVDQLTDKSTIGEAARVYENDLANVLEYALKLENVIKPIAEDQKTNDIKVVDPQQ